MNEKKCSKCGRTLSLDNFYKRTSAKDGVQPYCKECHKASCKESYQKKNGKVIDSLCRDGSLCKSYAHPELSKFTPRQLMEELKARGFRWEYMLEPQKRIMFEKI